MQPLNPVLTATGVGDQGAPLVATRGASRETNSSKVQVVVLVLGSHSNIIGHVDVPNSAVASRWVLVQRYGSTTQQWDVSMPERARPIKPPCP